MKFSKIALAALLLLMGVGLRAADSPEATATPTSPPDGKVSALFFGDFYDEAATSAKSNQGLDGLWLRRIWLTYDKDLGSGFSGRLRLEANEGDYQSVTATALPFIKDAWIKYAYAEGQSASLGLIDSGSVTFVEQQWGLRSVEKTPLDLQGWVATRDQGLSADGKLGTFGYHFGLGNGMSTGWASTGGLDQKKVGLGVSDSLGGGLDAWVEGELTSSPSGNYGPTPTNNAYAYTVQAFLGWKSSLGRLGLLYGRQVSVKPATDDEVVKNLVSIYGVVKVYGTVSAFARVDHLLWGTIDKSSISYLDLAPQRSTLAILGFDWTVSKSLSLQPNVEMASYQDDKGGPAASPDVIPRLTFLVQY